MPKTRQSLLKAEIKQGRPFHSPFQEGVLSILRTADVLRRRFEKHLVSYEITSQQYNVLRILRGSHPNVLPTLDIVQRMIEQEPGITRLLDRLESKGLVHREKCSEDKRRVLCRLTPQGMKLVNRLDGPVASLEKSSLGDLSKREAEELINMLERIRLSHQQQEKET